MNAAAASSAVCDRAPNEISADAVSTATCKFGGLATDPAAVAQILWRLSKPRPITIFWISDVPSPISSSGASRYRRSISYSLE